MSRSSSALLQGNPLPLLFRLAAPNTLAFCVQAMVMLLEIWFIGQLGTTELAAIALSFPLLMLVQTMSGGAIGGAVASSIARAVGGNNIANAERLIWHALIFAACGAAIFLGLFLLGGEVFLIFLGGTGDVLAGSLAYCTVLFWGGPLMWGLGVMTAVYRGMGNMKFPAALILLSAAIQIPLSGTLVLGAFGMPQLGIVGAAYGAIASSGTVALLMVSHLLFANNMVKLRVKSCQFSKVLFRDLLKVALPASLSPLMTVGTILSLTAIVSGFGEAALAGYGISSRIEFLVILLVFGLGSAMTSMVGMSVGAGMIARAERIAFVGGVTSMLIAGGVGLLLVIFSELWISLFTDDPAVLLHAKQYISLVGLMFGFQGLGFALYFASQGAGRMFWAATATFLRMMAAVGCALGLSQLAGMGFQAVVWGASLGMFCYGTTIALSVRLGAWRN